MMKISKKREKALNLRIDQLNEQVCELIDELKGKDAEIKLLQDRNRSLEGQLEEKALELSACRSGNLMATDIIDNGSLDMATVEKLVEVAHIAGALPELVDTLPDALEYGLSTFYKNWDIMIQDIYDLNPHIPIESFLLRFSPLQ